jgi:amidase
MDDLIKLTARAAVEKLKNREVSPLDLIAAAEARIAETDGVLNATPTLCLDRARAHAKRLMDSPPADPGPQFLHGLPIAIKDLNEVEGVRTTKGSPIFADHISPHSDYMVETLEANGAIVIGKSNTPELGAGSQTFNEVFGRTANPWNTSLTPGGSSGGAAAALAAGQVWLATGSDLGGSLRNPASFCSVVGLRGSPGRVAAGPSDAPFDDMPVQGPMARNVADTALMLDAMVGHHADDPLSLFPPAIPYAQAIAAPVGPKRVAFSPDLGVMPVEPEVISICANAAQGFSALGASVVDDCPDFSGAQDAFHVLRAQAFANNRGALLDNHRDLLKWEIIWNIEAGRALTTEDIARASATRAALFHRVTAFFQTNDLLLCPAAILPPFDGEMRWPEEVAGTKLEAYIDWLQICGMITLTGCPAISVPCGFTDDGRPIGLQIVAPPRREDLLLGAAHLFEQAHDYAGLVPIDPKPAH